MDNFIPPLLDTFRPPLTEVLGRRFVGVFDYHWVDYQIAGDWKTGKLDLRFTDGYEIQAFILSEMYKQKYDKPLEKFYFNFIRTDTIYNPKCIKDDADAKMQIGKALEGIESWSFNKSIGLLCDYCEYKSFCG